MKKILLVIFLSAFLWGCYGIDVCPTLYAPFGRPDKEYRWNHGPYEYAKFTYFCYDDRYIETTWARYGMQCWYESELISIPCN